MSTVILNVPIEGGHSPRSGITPETLRYALDLTRRDPATAGFLPDPAHEREVVDLYNAAVRDGRFVRHLGSDPEGVAQRLNIPLSRGAADAIKQIGLTAGAKLTNFPSAIDPRTAWVTVVCVAVIVVVAAKPDRPDSEIVLDTSGIMKP